MPGYLFLAGFHNKTIHILCARAYLVRLGPLCYVWFVSVTKQVTNYGLGIFVLAGSTSLAGFHDKMSHIVCKGTFVSSVCITPNLSCLFRFIHNITIGLVTFFSMNAISRSVTLQITKVSEWMFPQSSISRSYSWWLFHVVVLNVHHNIAEDNAFGNCWRRAVVLLCILPTGFWLEALELTILTSDSADQ